MFILVKTHMDNAKGKILYHRLLYDFTISMEAVKVRGGIIVLWNDCSTTVERLHTSH